MEVEKLIKVNLSNEILRRISAIDENRFSFSTVELPTLTQNRLRKNSKKRSSYASNKIEGNPLTEQQANEAIESDPHTYDYGMDGPIIIWGMFPHRENELDNSIEAIRQFVGETAYTLVVFQVEDWNKEFSPWTSEQLDASFSGGADTTLEWLLNTCIPKVKETYGSNREIYLMGYSLAGLFALWALTKTDVFAGAASCSGSLWYPRFVDYINDNCVKEKRIYLSLGGKEAKTANPLMARIADCTGILEQHLKKQNIVKMEMNPGGHFADSGKRLAKAVKWIVSHTA